MLTKNFSLLFYLKRRSNYVSGNLPIYIRITINGRRVEITAQRDVSRKMEYRRWA